ncbi:hypothetical protein [Enterobacteria phage PPompW_699]|nr:hypothetical protein [Enterobacteria phage PPompW_699]BCI49908.1 hypothetical protein [Enterobacteria phage PPompW_EH1992]BCI50191.1 hypothetical protein [Enterobacteria phage PPompW_EH2246]
MMAGPGISVMSHSRVRRCWFAWERRSTSRCDVRQVRKRNVMRSIANVELFATNPKKPEIRT